MRAPFRAPRRVGLQACFSQLGLKQHCRSWQDARVDARELLGARRAHPAPAAARRARCELTAEASTLRRKAEASCSWNDIPRAITPANPAGAVQMM